MHLVAIWNKIKKVSYEQRKINKNFDGKLFWKKIKEILEKEKSQADSFKAVPKKLAEKVLSLPEYHILGNGRQEILEHNHFIIQTFRIPMTEKPTIKKIMQVALNIGQCKGMGGKYDKDLVGRTKIDNYISKKDIIRISNELDEKNVQKLYEYLSTFEK